MTVGFFFTDDAADAHAGRPAARQRDDRHPAGRARLRRRRSLSAAGRRRRARGAAARAQPRAADGSRGAICPTAPRRWLIAIDDWDFRWQDVYRYAAPFALPKGTTLSMRYVYDNSADNPRNPHRPPARVVWGQNTVGRDGRSLDPGDPARRRGRTDPDRGLPPQGARRRSGRLHQAAAAAIRPTRCATTPWRASIWTPGSWTKRSPSSAQSLRLNRESAPTHYNLGFALSARGRRDEAIAAFQEALRIDPDYAQAHNNLGALLQLAGSRTRRSSTIAARWRCGPTTSRRTPTSGSCCRSAAAPPRRRRSSPRRSRSDDDNVQALAGLAWIRATAADPSLRDAGGSRSGSPSGPTRRQVTRMSRRSTRWPRRTRPRGGSRMRSASARLGLDPRDRGRPGERSLRNSASAIELYQKGQPLRIPEP